MQYEKDLSIYFSYDLYNLLNTAVLAIVIANRKKIAILSEIFHQR